MKSLVIMLIAFFAVFLQPPQVEAKGFTEVEYITQDIPPMLAAVVFVINHVDAEKGYCLYSDRCTCRSETTSYINSDAYLINRFESWSFTYHWQSEKHEFLKSIGLNYTLVNWYGSNNHYSKLGYSMAHRNI